MAAVQRSQRETTKIGDSLATRAIVISLPDLIKAKKRGCQTCFAILTAIDRLTRDWLPLESNNAAEPYGFLKLLVRGPPQRSWVQVMLTKCLTEVYPRYLPVEIICQLELTVRVDGSPRGAFAKVPAGPGSPAFANTIGFGFEMYSLPGSPVPWYAFGPARHVPPKLHSKHRQKLVQSWIETCDKSHECCYITTLDSLPGPGKDFQPQRKADPDTLEERTGCTASPMPISTERTWRPPPRRLLDLGGNPRNFIRLVDTRGLSGRYATLTIHVLAYPPGSRKDTWPISFLSHANLARLRSRISWADLPPGYQNAVAIAAEQGIRYLWIYALCVLANDQIDAHWHAENMHEIYGQSYLNIALVQSGGDHRKALGTRHLDPGKESEVKFVQINLVKDGKTWTVFARSKLYNSHDAFEISLNSMPESSYVAKDCVQRFPTLFRETWSFQQRLLAPRTVHISGSEMVWECRTCRQCECSLKTHTMPPGLDPLRETSFSFSLVNLAFIPYPINKDASLRHLWRHIWPVYSRLRSFANGDRLSAILGLATLFQKRMGQAFVAGHFANNTAELAEELLWGVERNPHPRSFPEPVSRSVKSLRDTLPSWAWLSVLAGWGDAVKLAPIVRAGCFCVSPHLHVKGVATELPWGGFRQHPFTRGPSLNATRCTLHMRGEVILGKIATSGRHRGCYQFVPANILQFPPSLVPLRPQYRGEAPIAAQAGPALPNPIAANSPHLARPVSGQDPRLGMVPVSSTSSSRSASPSPPPPHNARQPPLAPRPFDGYELLSSMGIANLDCDIRDGRRKERGTPGRDEMGNPSYTYAFFLLLGTVSLPVSSSCKENYDVGLVLTRVMARPRTRDASFQRQGYFTIPRVPGRGVGDFFKEAEVQDVNIV